jgi:hypothetical protein
MKLLALVLAACLSAAACDRTCLNGFVDHHLAALVAHDPSPLQIAALFKIENGKIRQIEAVIDQCPYGMDSGWSPASM